MSAARRRARLSASREQEVDDLRALAGEQTQARHCNPHPRADRFVRGLQTPPGIDMIDRSRSTSRHRRSKLRPTGVYSGRLSLLMKKLSCGWSVVPLLRLCDCAGTR
ncbi:hypothetical protein KC19_2G217100 [Ceratodon purpureus]|uniref:Uncharacterized protein n=1 Tax=Ceratodon purpureus TaxID=3225 RepID=A0A8T0IY35_CERPU|nr:hypothetical protein KC19_2G217100 [Ceratodon purpureus]